MEDKQDIKPKVKNLDLTSETLKCNENELVLSLEINPRVFSAYFIDFFIVFMGFLLVFVFYYLNIWWGYLLAIIIFLVSLGLGKSLFLKRIILYEDKIILQWFLFKDKVVLIENIKEVRDITATWDWKLTLLEKQPFDYRSLWIIINESILGEENYTKLRKTIKKLIGKE